MKKTLSLAVVLLCSFFVFAQNQLLVQSSNKGLYLEHKVVAKENYYSIGRLYNVSPKEIEAFNGLDMNKGLVIGQMIKVPLNANNFSQTTTNGRAVYYVVGAKEGLYRVSLKNNNVLMANLRKWNKLTTDKINPGEKLVVGYLVSSNANSIVQSNPEPEVKQPPVEEKKTEEKKETVIEEVKEEPKKQEQKQSEEKRVEPAITQPVKQTTSQVAVTDGNGGYFKPQFESQIKSQPVKSDVTASAGIFKTSSGWQDAKYYALMDNVEPGTIIKIVNPTNSKAIYAKVLGEMSGIRQNQGYDVRISNAAASALDVSDTEKFIVRVNY